jgi:hypothetical protein
MTASKQLFAFGNFDYQLTKLPGLSNYLWNFFYWRAWAKA